MVRAWAAVGLAAIPALIFAACTFDPTGLAGTGSGSEADAGEDDEGADDQPVECPEPLHVELSVDGRVAADDDPLTIVLLGDTVALSAAGSCSRGGGQLTYRWEFDGNLGQTADAPDDSESLTIYPSLPGEFYITLTVNDGNNSASQVAVLRARPWSARSDQPNVESVALADNRVWMATSSGAVVFDLAAPELGIQPLLDVAPGDEVTGNVETVHFAEQSGHVWFGRGGNTDQVFRVDLSAETTTAVDLPDAVDLRDIDSLGAGVLIGHRDGVLRSANNEDFENSEPSEDIFAVTGADGGWAGGRDLHRVGNEAEFSAFPEPDDRIRALAGAGDLVWAGSDNQGVARFNTGTGRADVVYTAPGDLPSNAIRALAVENNGDVWAATDQGVARYKRDRDVWIAMGEDTQLEGNLLDVSGIAVLQAGGKRVVAIGTAGGIAILSQE
jgi:PKD domain